MPVVGRAIDGHEQILIFQPARIIREARNPDRVEGLGASEFDIRIPEKLK